MYTLSTCCQHHSSTVHNQCGATSQVKMSLETSSSFRLLKIAVSCRWFGLGFLLYWCFATPLLYKCYRWRNARGLWQYTCCQHNLWATYLLSLVSSAIMSCSAHTQCTVGILSCHAGQLLAMMQSGQLFPFSMVVKYKALH